MHPDRFFDPDPAVRGFARALYEETSQLAIVSPHGHVDARVLAENVPFPEPASLLIVPDHYILRMLYSQGVPLERLGIAARAGAANATLTETDARRIWQLFADHYHLFRATPTAAWLDYQFAVVFGIDTPLTSSTAIRIYDEMVEKLGSPEFRPRALFERFDIEVLATTDAATDALEHHAAIHRSGWQGRVIPTFRPDAAFNVAAPTWTDELARLEAVTGTAVNDYGAFITALQSRRAFFRGMGATATDHGVETPLTARLDDDARDEIFGRALDGQATAVDQQRFVAHMLMEMGRCSVEDGLVMQLHAGSLRNHNRALFERFGPDRGADIPVATEYTRNLQALLNAYGSEPTFRLILFTLDESTYSRELAPLAGHYPAVRLGPAWWFHDSIQGMMRYRERVTETAGVYNTTGFNDDTRAFCSIPARHDLSRRVDANWLAGLVARHVVTFEDARVLAHALAYGLAKEAYRL